MLHFTRETDYALQLLKGLSDQDGHCLSLSDFSQESTISIPILQKVARQLRVAGLIQSIRGKGGGYLLTRPTKNIHLSDVVHAIEGKIGVTHCLKKNNSCKSEKGCSARKGFERINGQIIAILDSTSVQDFFEHKTYA
ncbi:Rrf2 family transcriptional regulator [Candidatus Nomurabacteria bacterium]|nr:Rrf2 family transcriptional regulator [Candidatus Nomurabacteria bacterium]